MRFSAVVFTMALALGAAALPINSQRDWLSDLKAKIEAKVKAAEAKVEPIVEKLEPIAEKLEPLVPYVESFFERRDDTLSSLEIAEAISTILNENHAPPKPSKRDDTLSSLEIAEAISTILNENHAPPKPSRRDLLEALD